MKNRPDQWVVLKITDNKTGENVHKILAGWGGSYLYGSSWKLNSGIVSAEHDIETYVRPEIGDMPEETIKYGIWRFKSHSGSIYECTENSYGLRMATIGTYNRIMKKAPLVDQTVEMLPEDTDWSKIAY